MLAPTSGYPIKNMPIYLQRSVFVVRTATSARILRRLSRVFFFQVVESFVSGKPGKVEVLFNTSLTDVKSKERKAYQALLDAETEPSTLLSELSKSSGNLAVPGSASVTPMDSESFEVHEDMVKLKTLTEASLLHNLRLRFMRNEIYTNIGTILCSVNPFQLINVYGPDTLESYSTRSNDA